MDIADKIEIRQAAIPENRRLESIKTWPIERLKECMETLGTAAETPKEALDALRAALLRLSSLDELEVKLLTNTQREILTRMKRSLGALRRSYSSPEMGACFYSDNSPSPNLSDVEWLVQHRFIDESPAVDGEKEVALHLAERGLLATQ